MTTLKDTLAKQTRELNEERDWRERHKITPQPVEIRACGWVGRAHLTTQKSIRIGKLLGV